MNPTVSICIPTYNRKDYLKQTLDSIFAQTYKDYEVIVIDDGSTDGTKDMLERAGYNLRYCWQENVGEAITRNRLISLAHGKYIAFIDSDDLYLPKAIEYLVRAAENESGDVLAYGSYLRIDENGKIIGKSKRKCYSGFVTAELFQDIFAHIYDSIVPKKFFEQAGGFDESLSFGTDYDLWLRLSLKHRFVYVSKPTTKRRRHSGNISSGSYKGYSTILRVLERFYYEKGGRQIIPKRLAMRRLSRAAYRAGRCAVNEGLAQQGRELFLQSFRRYPNIKALIYWAKSRIITLHPSAHGPLK